MEPSTTSHNKTSVVILGNGKSLKKALITNILGKDLSTLTKRKNLKNTVTYDNDTYEFTCTPDLNSCEDIREIFSKSPTFDLCLLVVEDGLSPEDVFKQVEDLTKKTGKPKEEFTVVLPLGYKSTGHPFRFCSLEQVYSKLHQDKQMATNRRKRPADSPEAREGTERKRKLTTVNLVLLGMSGTGKSASGNTILGKRVFTSIASSRPITTECQVAETQIRGTRVRVIDTPDMFDDDLEASVRDRHVRRCRELFVAGPSVFVLVMHVSRFTDGERDVLRKLEKAFGNKVREETVILFTRGEDLQQADMSLEEFLHSCQPELKEIIDACGCRCVLFENRSSEAEQVGTFMQTVIRMIQQKQ